MPQGSFDSQAFPTSGNIHYNNNLLPDTIYFEEAGAVTLTGNVVIDTTNPPSNYEIGECVVITNGITLGAYSLSIFDFQIPAWLATAGIFTVKAFSDGAAWTVWNVQYAGGAGASGFILDGSALIAGSTPLTKLASGTSGQIIVCNVGGVPTYVTVSGDITMSNAGVAAIAAGVIVDADVNAAAAIARTKLGLGTADHVLINGAGGAFSSEAQLANSRGGTGQDTSASTGFPVVTAGTWGVGALTDVRHLDNISFVTANQGTYYVYFPFACTVTNINVRVTSVISGTDDGGLTIANNAGTVMTGSALTAGVLAVAASATFGTGYASTLLTNNTFTAGQSMQITSAKTTTGGVVSADITYTRTS